MRWTYSMHAFLSTCYINLRTFVFRFPRFKLVGARSSMRIFPGFSAGVEIREMRTNSYGRGIFFQFFFFFFAEIFFSARNHFGFFLFTATTTFSHFCKICALNLSNGWREALIWHSFRIWKLIGWFERFRPIKIRHLIRKTTFRIAIGLV